MVGKRKALFFQPKRLVAWHWDLLVCYLNILPLVSLRFDARWPEAMCIRKKARWFKVKLWQFTHTGGLAYNNSCISVSSHSLLFHPIQAWEV